MRLTKNSLYCLFSTLALATLLWSNTSAAFFDSDTKSLPEFSVPNLFNTSKQMTNRTLTGRVCLLNVWASWCRYCYNEHAMLLKIKNQYHIPIYGLDYRDNPVNARTYLAKFGNPYTMVGVDWSGDVGSNLGTYGTPQTYIIDKHGVIRYRYTGGIDQSGWENTLLPLIKKYQNEA